MGKVGQRRAAPIRQRRQRRRGRIPRWRRGIPGGGIGGGGMGRGRRGGMGGPAPIEYHGVVRWVSAKPIQEALKSPVPEGLANAYVISATSRCANRAAAATAAGYPT